MRALLLIPLYLGVHWSFVAIMSAKAKRAELTPYWVAILLPLGVVGWVLDFAFNYSFGWMFLAVPRPYLFSHTVQHHYSNGSGWRQRLAAFFAKQLNVFDPLHIK